MNGYSVSSFKHLHTAGLYFREFFAHTAHPAGNTMTHTATASTSFKREAQLDRRQNRATFFGVFRTNGRRKTVRRSIGTSTIGHYLDHYDARLFIPSLIILVLCMIDAHITLNLLARGATELNVVMKLAIEKGVVIFLVTKYAMTASSVVFLVIHHQFRIFNIVQVRHIIYGYAWVYIALLAYEIALWTYAA